VRHSLALSTYSLAHCARPPSRDRKFTHTHANPSRQAGWIASSLTCVRTSQLSSVPTPFEPSRRRQKRTLRPWPCSTARRFEHCGVIAAPRYTRASVSLLCDTISDNWARSYLIPARHFHPGKLLVASLHVFEGALSSRIRTFAVYSTPMTNSESQVSHSLRCMNVRHKRLNRTLCWVVCSRVRTHSR
jgi:hypothetical protein